MAPNNCDETTDKRDSDKENVDSAPPTPTSSSAHLHTTPFVSRPSKKQRTVRTKKATPSLKSTKGKTRYSVDMNWIVVKLLMHLVHVYLPYIGYISTHEYSRVSIIQRLTILYTWPCVILLYIAYMW